MLDWIKTQFDPAARAQRSFDKLTAKLVSKNFQHEDRMAALAVLAEMDTPAATAALFRRWDSVADKDREDRTEKEYLAEILVEKGPKMLDALRRHNERSVNVTWPIQVLRRVASEQQVVDELLRVLALEGGRLASFKPEKKVHLLRLLKDHQDPRVPGAVSPFLGDFDEGVRHDAAELLGRQGDEASDEALAQRLLHPEEDSARVIGAIVAALAARAWSVGARREAVQARLSLGWAISGEGHLVRP